MVSDWAPSLRKNSFYAMPKTAVKHWCIAKE